MPKDKHLLKKVIVFVCPCITLVSQETWPRKSRSFGEQRGEEEELAPSSSQSKDFQNGGAFFLSAGYGIGKKFFFAGGKGGRKEIVSVLMDFLFRGGIPTFLLCFWPSECFKYVCAFLMPFYSSHL